MRRTWEPMAYQRSQDRWTTVLSSKLQSWMTPGPPSDGWNLAHFWFFIRVSETCTSIHIDKHTRCSLGLPVLDCQPCQFFLYWDMHRITLNCIPSSDILKLRSYPRSWKKLMTAYSGSPAGYLLQKLEIGTGSYSPLCVVLPLSLVVFHTVAELQCCVLMQSGLVSLPWMWGTKKWWALLIWVKVTCDEDTSSVLAVSAFSSGELEAAADCLSKYW